MKFKLRWFPEEASYSAEKGYTDINLPPIMSNEDKNISCSSVLDIRKWWRQVQAKNYSWSSHNFIVLATVFSVQWCKIAMLYFLTGYRGTSHFPRPYSYSWQWPGTSLQRRLIRGFSFEFTPRVSLTCKLVPVHYREYEYSLLYFLGTYTRQKVEKMYSVATATAGNE